MNIPPGIAMRIINVGSLNIDHVYEVAQLVRPGETIRSTSYRVYSGGKGFNQSIALARAGALIGHVGKVGADGGWLKERLRQEGVDVTHLKQAPTPTGHAVIQVDSAGQNSIVLFGGANEQLESLQLVEALSTAMAGDFLLVQNETNAVAEAIRLGSERGMQVVLNPAPMTPQLLLAPLNLVDLFVLNETEAEALTGTRDPEQIRAQMLERFPKAKTVLTMGQAGAIYFDAHRFDRQSAIPVTPVDTTAAGDTFLGFFLDEFMRSNDPIRALYLGCQAAALCVIKPGAADSIPSRAELESTERPRGI